MTTLSDAKLTALQTLTGTTGHVNDLEQLYLSQLVTGPAVSDTIQDLWDQVFTEAGIAAGQFNDRWYAYTDFILSPATEDGYNGRSQEYWENGGTPIGPVAPAPPGAPLLWYDFADASQVFSDIAGLLAAVQGDTIRRVNDKGSQGQDLIDSGSSLTYDVDVINGLNAALSTAITAMDNNFGFGTGGAGLTFACVAKHDGGPTQQKVFNWDGSRLIQQDELGSGNWECVVPNVPTTADTGAPVIDGEFIGVYLKHNNSLDFDVRASGQAEVVGSTIDFFNVGAFETFQIGVFDGHISEVLVYGSFLDGTDSQALMDYFDAKYGTLPRLADPPFFANVQHWFDFNDVSTMFSDTAGLIPITQGDEILRMNNKGSDGQPIISSDAPGGNRNPFFEAAGINGLGVAHGPHSQPNVADLGVSNPLWLSAGNAAGITIFTVTRKSDPALAFTENVQWTSTFSTAIAGQQTSTTWRQGYAGNAIDTLKPIVNNEWGWHYMTAGPSAGGIIKGRTAGVVEQTFADPYVPVGATGGPFNIAAGRGDTAEVIIYDRELMAAELQVVIDYLEQKFGTMPFISAPLTGAELLHHFDFTQPATVFRNAGGNQPAANGDIIRVVDNLGTDGTALTGTAGTGPTYRTGVINGLNIADFDSSSEVLNAIVAAGQNTSLNGLSMALVFRWKAGPGATNSMSAWGSNLGRTTAGRFGQWFIAGAPGNVSSLGALGADTWYLGAAAFDGPGGGTDRWQWSGEALQTAILGFLSDVAPGSTLAIANAATTIEVAEFAVWDGQLSAAEFTELFTFADNKYGTLPIFAPPLPALGSLTHHVDPSDASTVWADAAATIPAVDGGTVDRIDNKGTDGTPLASVTGSPIYRTGLLNGENVIEFSGANLTALAVAAGLTISTTGYTIAMVTRRRASHIGDSILWRWTPFAGSPGPSLRGRFSLNGNFHRADPIADEDLVANPSVIDQWYLLYFSAEAGGATDDAKFGSPGPEVAGPWADLTDIAPGSDVRFGTSSTFVEHAEAWFWNRPLTSVERAQLVAYADAKYGTLPHL